ncbi:hypothetical protein V6260_09315 [Pseudoalteromonas aliena]
MAALTAAGVCPFCLAASEILAQAATSIKVCKSLKDRIFSI